MILLLSVVLSIALSSTALGQRADTLRRDSIAARLPTVEVIGSILPIAGPAIGSSVPARASVIVASEVEAWNPRLLSDAVVREPGVSLYDDLGSAYKTTLVTRGFTASPVVGLPQGVSVFVDGVPVNEPDAGQVNFDLLPLEHVSRLEVLSGTASLLGPNSLGGAINLVTRRGDEASEGEIEVTGGSYDDYSVKLSSGGPIARGWRYYAGGGYAGERGWRQVTGARRGDGFLNIGRRGPMSGLNFQAHLAAGFAETAGSLPLSVYRVRPDSNLSAEDFEDLDQVHVAVSGHRRVQGGFASAVAWFRQSDAERFNVNQAPDPNVRSFSNNRTSGGSVDWRVGHALGRGTLGLRLGAGGSASRSRVRIYAEQATSDITTHVESPIRKLDAYGVADYTLGPATLSAGLRYDVVRIPFRNRLDAARDTTSVFHRLSPRGGVSIALAESGAIYVSAGRSFRAPAIIELACADPNEPCPLPFALGDDPPLDPVVATTVEAGGRWTWRALELNASVYRTDVRNEIFLFPYDDASEPAGSTIDGYFDNLARTRRAGIELAARAHVRALSLYATYALTRATFQVDDVAIFSVREEAGGENEVERGDRLPLIPEHTASLDASLRMSRRVEVGVNVRHTGERILRGDEANEEPALSSYWVTDARAARAIGSWELEALMRNVFDVRYAGFGTFNINRGADDALERFLTPGAPRRVQVVLRRRFGRGTESP
jgi:outer membrane receptor protein involved in Fe transport